MRVLSDEEKVNLFSKELVLIYDPVIKEFTRLCLLHCPEYFFLDCPASSSGKYHSIDELSGDGTVIHTKRVFTVAYDLCVGLGCEKNRDLILSACIIHDLVKQGRTKTGHTVKNHPALAAELINQIQEATQLLNERDYNIVRNCVGYHYGRWSTSPWLKPIKEYTPEELCVYMSDYIASKKCVSVSYTREG